MVWWGFLFLLVGNFVWFGGDYYFDLYLQTNNE